MRPDGAKGLFAPTRTARQIAMSAKMRQRYQRGQVAQQKPRAAKGEKPKREFKLDIFAEHLANGKTPGAAARAMGLKTEAGHEYLRRLRKRLGPQAV